MIYTYFPENHENTMRFELFFVFAKYIVWMVQKYLETGWGDEKQVSQCATVEKTQNLWISAIFGGFCSIFDLVASSANLLGVEWL